MKLVAVSTAVLFFASVTFADDHTPLRFSVSGNNIIAVGEIDANSLDWFEDTINDHPQVDTLVLQYVGGSVDDDANLEFALAIRDLGFATVVPSDGLVASGGTDLFLAGVDRILENGACVGVHAWASETFTALDLARSDPEHDTYLDYYDDIGIDEAFYWFTLESAPARGMYWMTAQDAKRFRVNTRPASSLGSGTTCNRR